MPIYVRDIKIRLDEPETRLLEKIATRLKVRPSAIRTYAPVKRSLDARSRGEIGYVYCVELALDEPPEVERKRVARLHRHDVSILEHPAAAEPVAGTTPMRQRPVIVGFGPAGMFAALRLAQYGYKPIVLERGQPVRIRHKDIMQKFYREGRFNGESNLLYGEGGAGTYSDGKLYTRVNHPYVKAVLQTLYENGAKPDILIDGRPHIGSDRLPNICTRIRQRIESLGGEIRFGARLDDLSIDEDGRLSGIVVSGTESAVDRVLIGLGHSARDTIRMLIERGVKVVAKPFQMGVRIEHPQALVDTWQYGSLAGHERLPPADYHLVAKGAAGSSGDMFSFCMCPGGIILPTNESPNLIATNGASPASRGGAFANSGLVITIQPTEFGNDPLRGLSYQRQWESSAFEATGGSYAVPAQRAADFVKDRESDGALETSYPLGGQWVRLKSILPVHVAQSVVRGLQMLHQRLEGFAGADAIITAPETRASAPIRILRDPQTRQSVSVAGLYPIGEGSGYAGGILSAAVDGMQTADQLITSFAPLR